MADVITRLKVESSEYDAKIKRATQSLNEMTTAAEREGNKIATANKENIALAQSLGKMATVSTTARGKMGELSSAIESATLMYNRLSQAEKQGQFGKALNASITQLQGRLKGLQGEMAAVQGNMGIMGAGGGGMGIAAQFGSGLKSAAAMFGPAALAIGGVTAAIGGMKKVIGDMVSLNMQFEQSTANLASIMGKSTEEISALTEQAKQLGATTRYTANEITELQTNLARLGFTQQEILNSTSAVQALATATGADLGEAANLAGAALRGFGLNATEMERVASVLSVSTTKSALSFEKLATAVPIVAPVAKQFGFTIEDTVTLLAKLSDAGMDASTAATATRNIFLKMADGSGKLSQAMGRPVHSVEEFGEALAEMREKGMSLNDILNMVGVRSTAAFAVFADNAGTLKDFKDSITDCSEAMHDMEAKQLNTLQGSLTILQSAYEGLMLTFSESNGTIKTVVDSLTELLGAWTKWRKRNQGGDAAITQEEIGLTDETKKEADAFIEAEKASGKTADAIKADASKKIEALEKEEKALEDLEKAYKEYEKNLNIARNSGDVEKAVGIMDANPLKGTNYIGKGKSFNNIYKDAAAIRDQITQQRYIIDSLTAPSTNSTSTSGSGGGVGGTEKDLTSKRRAQIEAQMQEDIAALDKANMIKLGKESEYEDDVYQIKRDALEQIKQLYAEDSKEYAQVRAKIAQLDIQYQGTQMRLANKGGKGRNKEMKVAFQAGYSEEGIGAMRKQMQDQMSGMQVGSKEYIVQAQNLVDLTAFENLLKTAVQNGIQLDPAMLESYFEAIDDGAFKIEPAVSDEAWATLVDTINEKLKELNLDPIELDVKTGGVSVDNEAKKVKGLGDGWNSVASAIGTVSGALQGLEDPSAKIAGLFQRQR